MSTKQQAKAIQVGKAMSEFLATEPTERDVRNILELMVIPFSKRAERSAFLSTVREAGLAMYNASTFNRV